MAGFAKKFESAKQDWTTPREMFAYLDKEFRFDLDLAASAKNTLCSRYFDKAADALQQDWKGICWLNPPYGEKSGKLSDWVKKAHAESAKWGSTIVMLIPARTNTRWWHQYCMDADELRFLQGRPKFGDAIHGLPQPLALIIFRPHRGITKLGSFDV
jgi:phage N-6-adenine-methyltransferase